MRRLDARVQEMQESQVEAAKLMAEEWNKQMGRAEEWKAEEEDKMKLMIAEGEKRSQLVLQAYMLEMETRLSAQASIKARSLEVEVQACKELVQGSRQDAGRMEGMMTTRLSYMQMQTQQMYNMMREQHGGNGTCEESSGELRRIESMLRKANGLPVRGQQQATTTEVGKEAAASGEAMEEMAREGEDGRGRQEERPAGGGGEVQKGRKVGQQGGEAEEGRKKRGKSPAGKHNNRQVQRASRRVAAQLGQQATARKMGEEVEASKNEEQEPQRVEVEGQEDDRVMEEEDEISADVLPERQFYKELEGADEEDESAGRR